MRCDQFMGLPANAISFLAENAAKIETCCSHCKRPYFIEREVIGHFLGMFMEKYPLFRHQLKDKTYADDFNQCSPWSSGSCHFTGLRLENGTEFTWTEEEIEDWL